VSDVIHSLVRGAGGPDPVFPSSGDQSTLLEVMRTLKAEALAESHRLRAEARAQIPTPPPQPVTGWTTTATCPNCGGHLEHITSGRPGPDTRAIAGCPGCGRRWSITASIRDATADLGRHPRPKPHPVGCRCAAHRGAA
jgi:hypothetical protein